MDTVIERPPKTRRPHVSSTMTGRRLERSIKKLIKEVLDKYRPQLYYDMPVPSGYGKSTLDFIGCFRGRYFSIEAKAPRKEPSERQDGTIKDMTDAGARVFVIDGEAGVVTLSVWLAVVALEMEARDPAD